MYKGIGTASSSTLTLQSHDLQSSLHSALQIHSIKHKGANLHIFKAVQSPNYPLQVTNSLTPRGITYATPKTGKANSIIINKGGDQ
jgi:hypothetical protein